MYYCENNTSISLVWSQKGISRCFFDTVTSCILFGFIAFIGSIEYWFYRKYATPIERRFLKRPFLFRLQISFHLLLCVESIIYFIIVGTVIGTHQIFGYAILHGIFASLQWLFAIVLILLERRYALPSIPTRGHGFILLIFWSLCFVSENLAFLSWWSPKWWWSLKTQDNVIDFGFWIVRYISTCSIFLIGLRAPGVVFKPSTFLGRDTDEENLVTTLPEGRCARFWSRIKMLWPYLWPKQSWILQFCVFLCFLILIAGRGVNLLMPIYYKEIVNSLTPGYNATQSSAPSMSWASGSLTIGTFAFRWDLILVYSTLRFLQGGGSVGMGLLSNLRSFLWIRIDQYSTREISVKLFSHLHALSLRWHLGRKTGEVLRIMDRGTSSVNNLLDYVVFSILPTIVDIIIAIIYFISAFNVWFGVIVFLTMVIYLVATIALTEWRTKFRQSMNLLDNDRNAKGVDSLLNFETVKYYGAEDYETQRYRRAIVEYQKAEWVSDFSLCVLNTIQNAIVSVGLLTGSLLCAKMVAYDEGLSVGDFVLFGTYVMQLYGPLNFFGTYYRMIQQSFIDMENMFDLLAEQQEIKDTANAPPLYIRGGKIEFDHVCFHYEPSKPILKNVSFTIPAGKTWALVGPSGSGKSTIIRLLFRFYDLRSGQIRVDDQDIAEVRQSSLRQSIGVVPQDTVLFNDDIRYNIRYGRTTAADEEVEEAARVADIHERVLTFPSGYATRVGERGLKLSGGEKQRVAIARTVLKAPVIVLLDEATSALDTATERTIQASLARICENRTTLVVAHRLSTIIGVDNILVIRDGEIVESGPHKELLQLGGLYNDLWLKQLTAQQDEAVPDTK